MQFYIAIDGEKRGPLSIIAVTEMLREGQVAPDALGWHQGSEKWAPLQEHPAFESVIKAIEQEGAGPEAKGKAKAVTETAALTEPSPIPKDAPPPPVSPETSARKFVVARDVHPFIRFWARIFDYWLVFTVVWWIVGSPFPGEPPTSLSQLMDSEQVFDPEKMERLRFVALWAFVIWHALEAIMIHTIGATPGKALFKIRVKRFDGGRPRLAKTLGRAYYVWIAGFGLGLMPLNLIAMGFGFFQLLSTGTCLWDKHLRLCVQHTPIGPARIVLAVAAFFLLMALQQIVIS